MKGKEAYNLLTKVEQEAFTANVLQQFHDPMLDYLFEKEFYNHGQLICSAFDWTNTPEGFDYWLEVSWNLELRSKQIIKYQLPTFNFRVGGG